MFYVFIFEINYYDINGVPILINNAMPVPSTNIRASAIQSEFGGSNPIRLSEYYEANGNIPSSGDLRYTDFAGESAPMILTAANGGPYVGYTGPPYGSTYGSLVPNTISGYTFPWLTTLPSGSSNYILEIRVDGTHSQNLFTSMKTVRISNYSSSTWTTASASSFFYQSGDTVWQWFIGIFGAPFIAGQQYQITINA